ncbi:MAG: Holliday junction branch migration protein RuvA [Lachnospiraceae bacterium]|nr:Holliday junction branch migration protein RuvA [Lachnospiraceae bacterium]
MYSYIKGELVEIAQDTIVVENHGIGYNIRIPGSIIDSLEGVGQEVKIYTYTYVREDAMLLYGFLTRDDLMVFKLLIGVSGIGPKGALAILSVMTPDDLRFAVLADDDKTIAKAPGIGKKTAQRLIIELKDKLSLADTFVEQEARELASGAGAQGTVRQEAVEALVALGYSSGEAMKAVNGVEISEETTVEEVLKASLRQMSLL